jgi:hypothetical protein
MKHNLNDTPHDSARQIDIDFPDDTQHPDVERIYFSFKKNIKPTDHHTALIIISRFKKPCSNTRKKSCHPKHKSPTLFNTPKKACENMPTNVTPPIKTTS